MVDSKAPDESGENNDVVENGVANGTGNPGEPEALVVLADEEVVAIDLLCEDWKMMSLPYMVSLHASAVTCSQHVSGKYPFFFHQAVT